MNLRLRLALLLAAALTACSPHVEGNGVYAERVFDASKLKPFDRVAIGLPGVETDGKPPSASIFASESVRQVVLSGDENLLQHIEVAVDESGTLRTATKLDSYTAVHPPQLRIKVQTLVEAEAIAGASITVLDAAAPTFEVTAADHGHVTLTGEGGSALVVVLSGGAQLDASGYPVVSAQLALTGASRATVWPSGLVSGSAASGSAVLLKGGVACGAELTLSSGSTCGPLQ